MSSSKITAQKKANQGRNFWVKLQLIHMKRLKYSKFSVVFQGHETGIKHRSLACWIQFSFDEILIFGMLFGWHNFDDVFRSVILFQRNCSGFHCKIKQFYQLWRGVSCFLWCAMFQNTTLCSICCKGKLSRARDMIKLEKAANFVIDNTNLRSIHKDRH